jgi:hypothetical protein
VKAAAALAVALAALAAAGCGGGGRTCLQGATTSASGAERDVAATTYLTAVDVSTPDCADRVEFRFERTVPAWRVEYRPAAKAQTEDASGRHVAVAGPGYLVVRLSPAATARSDGSTLTRTYSGPRRVPAAGARHVHEVVKTGDFEAVVTWVIGVDGKRPYTASVDGSSLVVRIG